MNCYSNDVILVNFRYKYIGDRTVMGKVITRESDNLFAQM